VESEVSRRQNIGPVEDSLPLKIANEAFAVGEEANIFKGLTRILHEDINKNG